MIFKYFYITFLLLFSLSSLIGCEESSKAANTNVIPEDQFVEILVECQLAEAQVNVLRALQPIYKDSILNYYAGIFEQHQITNEDFYYSLKEYSKDPQHLDSIYSRVILVLKEKEKLLGDIQLEPSTLNAISRQDLGDVLLETPIANMLMNDSNIQTMYIKDTLLRYLDSNKIIIESKGFNRESIEFTFVLNTSSKIMLNQLKDYLKGETNKSKEK